MKTQWIVTIIGAIIVLNAATAFAQQEESLLEQVRWQNGPSIGSLSNIAEVRVPAGHVFANGDDTRRLMEAMHNPTSGEELGFLAPSTFEWFMVFEFDNVGYIRDDEKDSLDADAMLRSIKAGTEESNKERARRGWSPMHITGWEQRPRYNETTHNLEWAIRGESDGEQVINWNTRLLGRGGVMRVTLVTDPGSLRSILPLYSERLAGFSYQEGHRYAEFRQGDKMAQYGLSALVVGGATAVAVKSGAAKWLWKIIVIGVIAVLGLFKKLFSGSKG